MFETTYRFLRFPGGKARAFTTSYDDGVGADLRLMELMRQYGIRGTFNLNYHVVSDEDIDVAEKPTYRLSRRQLATYYQDFEIATHGATHPFYRDLPTASAVYVIVRDREGLEGMFGRIIRGHAFANGSYKRETLEALRLSGIIYARTVGSTGGFVLPEDFLEFHPTCHHRDPRLSSLLDTFLAPARYAVYPRLFSLWGHAYEFETDGNWSLIEEVFKRVGGREEVYYGGMEEIVSYCLAYRQLVFSMDSKRIHNPTATPIWIATDRTETESICIAPGETVVMDER